MAVPNYKPTYYPKLETRIVNGKSARVETYRGKIIRVYDDNNNITDDRTASLEKKFPPLLKPKINKSSQEVYQLNEIKLEHIDKEPVLKIPSLFKSYVPGKESKTDLPANGILNTPIQENQPSQLPYNEQQGDIMEPDLNHISQPPQQIEEGKAEIKTEATTDSPKQEDIKDIAPEKDTVPTNQTNPDTKEKDTVSTQDDSQKVEIKDIAPEKDTVPTNQDTKEKDGVSIQDDYQKVEIKDQEKDITNQDTKEKDGVYVQDDSQKVEKDQEKDITNQDIIDHEKDIVTANQELIVTADGSQSIEIKDQPQIDSQNKETIPILKDTINDVPNIITDSKLPISEGTTPPAATPSISTASTTSTISKLSHLKPIFGQGRDANNIENNIENDIENNTKNTENIIDTIPNTYTNRKEDNIIYNTSEHGKSKEKANLNKEDNSMVEEVLEEYKRNKWAEDRDYKKNIEEMARTSLDNKEKIADISEKLTGVEGKITENIDKIGDVDQKVVNLQDNIDQKVGNLQDNLKEKFGTLQNLQEHLQEHIKTRLGDVKRPVSETLGELCTGIDCIKDDIKKSQESSSELDKKMDSRFSELKDRIQKLEVPTYVCDNCGYDELKPLSSFCPNCGTPIYGWSDPETGNPVAGWSPYWKRGQRAKYPE